MDLKQNMKLVKHLMKTPVFFIDRFQQIYSFSNENLTGVFQNFDVKGKDCLCVQASSDQVMDLFVMGAKSVDTFDINPLTEPYFYLKKAAICAGLNPQDLLYFFNCYNFKETYQHILNSNTFRFLARYLEGDMLRFWEYVFTNYSTFQMKSHLFSFEQVHPKVLLHSLNYLDE